MSAGHTHSLYIWLGRGQWMPMFPVVISSRELLVRDEEGIDLGASRFLVTGGFRRNDKWLYLNNSWSTVTGEELAEAYLAARENDDVTQVRVISRIAGTRLAPGSEEAVRLSLGNTPQQEEIARAWGVDYTTSVEVGKRGMEATVETGPSLLVTMTALRHLTDVLVFPEERRLMPKGTGLAREHPTYQELLAHYDRTGELPEKAAWEGDQQLRDAAVGL